MKTMKMAAVEYKQRKWSLKNGNGVYKDRIFGAVADHLNMCVYVKLYGVVPEKRTRKNDRANDQRRKSEK